MKLNFKKQDLLSGVNTVLKAVPSKTTMTILECILIDATEGIIKLIANDMEMGIETIVEGDIITAGSVAVEAKLFSEIIRKLPDNDISMEIDSDYNATIKCEKATFNILCKSGDDFPYLAEVNKEKSITLSQFALKEVILQTYFSINSEKEIMCGELFEVKNNALKVVALDGHRIAIRKTPIIDGNDDISVIVPGKTLNEISKIINGGTEDTVNIYFEDNSILFEFNNTKVLSRLIEGEFYRIENMISHDYETKVSINKKDLLNCIERATLLVKEGSKRPIILTIEDDVMELNIFSFNGSMDETIEITKEGKQLKIGFDPKFLIEALRVIDDEVVDIYFVNSKSPCSIRNDEEDYIYLILPVNFATVN